MGKLFDYCMTGNWEETQRIALFKKIGNLIGNEKLSKEQIKQIQRVINN